MSISSWSSDVADVLSDEFHGDDEDAAECSSSDVGTKERAREPAEKPPPSKKRRNAVDATNIMQDADAVKRARDLIKKSKDLTVKANKKKDKAKKKAKKT